MKSIIKKALRFIVSFFHLLVWFIRQIIQEDFRNYLPYQSKAKPIYILGNGPSLIELIERPDFEEIRKNNHFCTVNFSILSPMFQQLKPEYLTVADPLFFQKPVTHEKIKQFKEELQKISWDIKLVIPYIYYKDMRKELKDYSHISVLPIHTNNLDAQIVSPSIRNFLYRKGLACPRVQNVVVGSIYSMINLGYNQIHLYGVDHSWTSQLCVNDENQVCLRDLHYYDTEKVEMKPWLKGNGESYKMHEVLRDLAHMFSSYQELKVYANCFGNISIINHSKSSFIDAFQKKK